MKEIQNHTTVKKKKFLLTQGIDAVAEGQERSVDVGSFHKPLATVQRVGGALGAGKIDEEQAARPHLLICAPHP